MRQDPVGQDPTEPYVLPDVAGQALGAVVAHHEPWLERPEAAAERHLPVTEVDDGARLALLVAQVGGGDGGGVPHGPGGAEPEAGAVEGGEEPLGPVVQPRVAPGGAAGRPEEGPGGCSSDLRMWRARPAAP